MKHIHFIGICGSGMGSLALLCKEAGFKVTGSDTACYPPMSDQLSTFGIEVKMGCNPVDLRPKPDLVVVGNVARSDHPEAVAAIEQKIPYQSLPQALSNLFLPNKKVFTVTGTHGKTTTSHLLAWVLECADLKPGFLIGGVGNNCGKSYQLGSGDFFVVEGDEYDSAFFDKNPKFFHYRPTGAILTSVEWDHVDIYPSFKNLQAAFQKFIHQLPSEAVLVACEENQTVRDLVADAPCRVIRYGLKRGNYFVKQSSVDAGGTRFVLNGPEGQQEVRYSMVGEQNLENAVAVWALARSFQIPVAAIQKAFSTFKGVKKRQEFVGEVKDVAVVSDFAHHPTAIRRTIQGIKLQYPGRRLWTIFEPRSNTSRRNLHYPELLNAFNETDRVIIAGVYRADTIPEKERLDVSALADELMCKKGIEAHYINGSDFILEFIVRGICPNDVVLFMSNGDFDHLPTRLLQKLERRKIYHDKKSVRSIKVRE